MAWTSAHVIPSLSRSNAARWTEQGQGLNNANSPPNSTSPKATPATIHFRMGFASSRTPWASGVILNAVASRPHPVHWAGPLTRRGGEPRVGHVNDRCRDALFTGRWGEPDPVEHPLDAGPQRGDE